MKSEHLLSYVIFYIIRSNVIFRATRFVWFVLLIWYWLRSLSDTSTYCMYRCTDVKYVPIFLCFRFLQFVFLFFVNYLFVKRQKNEKQKHKKKKKRIIAKCISAKLKTHFSLKENLKKCSSFEELEGTRYIRGNVCFDIKVFSSLYSTKPCLGFLLICFVREIKYFYQIL